MPRSQRVTKKEAVFLLSPNVFPASLKINLL